MIKQIITDIAYDKIQLSQALTRAKLVASKIKNDTFKQWLGKELEGYDYDDIYLPEYRNVWSPINLEAEFPFGRTETIPVNLPEDIDKEEADMVNHHRILEPISIVEEQISSMKDTKGYINLPAGHVQILAQFYIAAVSSNGGVIRSGNRVIGKVQYQNVLELTKQKLLDTLMQLDEEFPNLADEYNISKENTEKIQNIITNNIYGNNNPTNIAAGENIEQVLNQTMSLNQKEIEQLKELGVEQQEIEELNDILEKVDDKPTRTAKLMKWLGGVTASVAGRGLYDSLPAITEFVQHLVV